MKKRKTLYEWLSTKLVVIIKNEENFANKISLRISYSKIFLFSIIFIILFLSLYTWALNNFLGAWLNPEYKQVLINKKYVKLTNRVDSLEREIKLRDQFLENIKNVIEPKEDTPK